MIAHAATIVAIAAAAGLAPAQVTAPGFRLFGQTNATVTWLVDTTGATLHTWTSTFRPGVGLRLEPDGVLLRTIASAPSFGAGGIGGGVQRIALDDTLLWDWRYDGPGFVSHHDIEVLPNGNILMIAWEEKTVAETVAAGRDPALIAGSIFRPDHVIEVQQTGPTAGTIVWEWHLWDHLIQDFDPTKANYGDVAAHPELVDVNFPATPALVGDWNHVNSVRYEPVHDWIVLSSLGQNEVWIIDHGTTTVEAAGHTGGRWGKGGDLLYRWGNPAAYRAGTGADQRLFGQHCASVIPDEHRGEGNLLVFNNNAPGGTAVWELVLPIDAAGQFTRQPNAPFLPMGPIWRYSSPDFASQITSSAERLPNGNTLICSGVQARVFEVTPAGDMLWNYTIPGAPLLFQAHYVDRKLWQDASTLSLGAGGTVGLDLIAGAARAGEWYLVLGSVSGTAPGTIVDGTLLPLNFDGYMATTLEYGNVYPLADTVGQLDALGRAHASFSLPGGILPAFLAGVRFDHAFVAWNETTHRIDLASNAVGFTLVP